MFNNDLMKYGHLVTWAHQLVFALLLTMLAIITQGYLFPHSNHGQEVPPILAMLDPELYKNDFAIQSYLIPGVRFYYQNLIVFMVGSIGFSITSAYFSLYFISLFSFILATQKIAIHIAGITGGKNTWVPYFSAGLLVFWSLISLHSWGSRIFIPLAIPSSFAMGISIWGVYAAIKQKWVAAYFTFGVAAFLQFLVGFLPGLVLFAAFFLHTVHNKNWFKAGLSVFLWGIGLASVYLPMALQATSAPVGFNFLETFGLYRVPHHWSPSTGGFFNWISDTLLVIAALGLSRHLYKNKCNKVRWLALLCGSGILIVTLAVILNYLCVDVFQVTVIGKLQFQRIMPFGHFLIFSLFLFMAIQLIHEKRIIHAAILVLSPLINAFGLIALFIVHLFTHKYEYSKKGLFVFIAITALLVFISIYFFKYSEALEIIGWDSPANKGLIFLITIVITVIIIYLKSNVIRNILLSSSILFLFIVIGASTGLKPLKYISGFTFFEAIDEKIITPVRSNIRYDRTKKLPGLILAESFSRESNVNDVILLPPIRESFTSIFQLASRRAAFVSYKNVPYDDYHVWLWAERVKLLLGVEKLKPYMTKREQRDLFKDRSSLDIEKIARANGICYLVSRRDWHNFNGTILAVETIKKSNWLLWKLNKCSLTDNVSFHSAQGG